MIAGGDTVVVEAVLVDPDRGDGWQTPWRAGALRRWPRRLRGPSLGSEHLDRDPVFGGRDRHGDSLDRARLYTREKELSRAGEDESEGNARQDARPVGFGQRGQTRQARS